MPSAGIKGALSALGCSALVCVAAAQAQAATTSAYAPSGVAVGAHQAHHAHDEAGVSPQALAERERLIATGEASLARGDVDAARRAFEQAANMAHMGEIELGLLRTQMQAGEYREALAFAAHTAGVHLDDVEGAAFYAWLLNVGGQVEVADQALSAAENRAPSHPVLQAVRQRLQSGVMLPTAELLQGPARLAPFATGDVPDAAAQVAATGLLLADGQHALVPRSAVPFGAAVWVRNGLGHTVRAQRVDDSVDPAGSLGLALLSLANPLQVPTGPSVPPRDAFAGSPAFALDHAPDAAAQPAWPVLRAGFVGAFTSSGVRLGVALPLMGVSLRGGPVYDAGGRLVGMALAVEGTDRLVPIMALRARWGERFGPVASEPRPRPIGADGVYEQGLRSALQVLVAAP